MEVIILVLVLIGIALAIASGVWVAVGLVRAITVHSDAPTVHYPKNEQTGDSDM